MSTNIYVGNLPFSTNAEEIRDLFSTYGTVESVNLITDRETGRLRGFGFVEMSNGVGPHRHTDVSSPRECTKTQD